MPVILAGLLVLAVGATLILSEPRPPRAPQPLVRGGNLSAVVRIAPALVARVRGDR